MTRRVLTLALVTSLALSFGCADAEHSHGDHAAEDARGPHGGRVFEDGDFTLELSIFEDGVPPEFRAFPFRGDAPIDPSEVELAVTLRRLGDRVDEIRFAPRAEYLLGDQTVHEPHSFDAEIVAREAGKEHRFAFSTYENRVTLAADQLEPAGIRVEAAGPATIHERIVLNGRIAPNEDALAHVMPRFAGVVRSVHKRLGDPVAKSELLAVIESNESLHSYELRAPLAGTVIAKDVSAGEFVSTDRELYRIADLGTVWVDLDVYRRDFARLRVGQKVSIDAGDGSPAAETTLSYLSPIGSSNTQTLLARAILPNPDLSWRPGLFVGAGVEVNARAVPVAVEIEAIQRVRDWDVVFLADGDTFEAQPVELGQRDAERVEIVSGLAAGQRYVVTGSFVLKADVGKSGASHEH